MTSAPGLKLLLGRLIVLRCQLCWGGGTGGACFWGTHRDGCERRRKDLCQLAHAANCRPQFGTELWGAMKHQLKLAQSMGWLTPSAEQKIYRAEFISPRLCDSSKCEWTRAPHPAQWEKGVAGACCAVRRGAEGSPMQQYSQMISFVRKGHLEMIQELEWNALNNQNWLVLINLHGALKLMPFVLSRAYRGSGPA
eukprot:713453-Pelagomonas_calceolata.AAC.4